MSRIIPLVLALAALAVTAARAADADTTVDGDKKAVKAAGVDTDGPALLAFLKKRTLSDADRAKALGLVKKLGDEDFGEREEATKALIKMGANVRALLAEALRASDAEVRKRAQLCLQKIDKGTPGPEVLGAALRLVAHADPAGGVEALLNYLPSVEESEVLDEGVAALAAVGVKKGKADPALVKALADKLAGKRAAAGAALAKAGGKDHRATVLKLLKDPDVWVRQRVAVALLVEAKDKDAVPALIALLTAAEGDDWDKVDEALQAVGGEGSPPAPEESTGVERKKYQAAWEKWWKDNGAKADLAKLEMAQRVLGYTVIAEMNFGGAKGRETRVYEIDSKGKERWSIGSGGRPGYYPVSVQALRGDKVLIAEGSGNVSVRTTKDTAVWSKSVGSLVGARQMPSGRILVVCRNQLLELDAKDGKEVGTPLKRASHDIAGADKAKDGSIALVTTSGSLLRFDAKGKELKSFSIPSFSWTTGFNIQLLPGGRVLVPLYNHNKVVEYDASGKEVWSASVNYPTGVRRLSNGHTLITSTGYGTVVELNKAGKEVWAKKADDTGRTRVYCADKR